MGDTEYFDKVVSNNKINISKLNVPNKIKVLKDALKEQVYEDLKKQNADIDNTTDILLDELLLETIENWILYLKTRPQKRTFINIVVSIVLSFAGVNRLIEYLPKIYDFIYYLLSHDQKDHSLINKCFTILLLLLTGLLIYLNFVNEPEKEQEKNRLYILFLESIHNDLNNK